MAGPFDFLKQRYSRTPAHRVPPRNGPGAIPAMGRRTQRSGGPRFGRRDFGYFAAAACAGGSGSGTRLRIGGTVRR
jgi:hypothetical protein